MITRASVRDLAFAIAAQVCGFGLLGQPANAAPPPPNWGAATTDCRATPVYAIDSLICEDLELAHLNAALAARIAAPGAVPDLPISHDQWYRASRLCAQRADAKACILEAYLERLRQLGPIVDGPKDPSPQSPPIRTVPIPR